MDKRKACNPIIQTVRSQQATKLRTVKSSEHQTLSCSFLSSKSSRVQFCWTGRYASAHNCSRKEAHLLIKVQSNSIARHFYTVSASGMSCQFCGKPFKKKSTARDANKKQTCLRNTMVKTMFRQLEVGLIKRQKLNKKELHPWVN